MISRRQSFRFTTIVFVAVCVLASGSPATTHARPANSVPAQDGQVRDPLVMDAFVQLAKLTASDGQLGDALGFSTAISADGSTIVIGAPNPSGPTTSPGAAYIFVKPAIGRTTTWTFAAKLTVPNGLNGEEVGGSVAISGDGGTVLVGAPFAPVGSNISQGAAYLFGRPASGWATTSSFTAELTASDGATLDGFGTSVASSSDGSTVVVGATVTLIGTGPGEGAVYLFVKPTGGWVTTTETAKLSPSDGAPSDQFGKSVAITGDGSTVVVGAFFTTIGSNPGQGAAYVFVKPASGWATTSSFTAELTASDGAAFDDFGYSVATSSDGDTVAVGATNKSRLQGAAYVFVEPTSGWATTTETAKLTASDGAPFDEFGFSLATSGGGHTLVVGALATVGSNLAQGAAYVFVKPGSGWATTSNFNAKLTASDGAFDDVFGWSVAISGDGDTLAVGAPFANIGANFTQGATYVFRRHQRRRR